MESRDYHTIGIVTNTTNFNCSLDNHYNGGREEVIVKDENDSFQVPCIICYTPVVVQDNYRYPRQLNVDDDEDVENDRIFQWFLLKFMTAPKKRTRVKKVTRFDQLLKTNKVGWDGQGGGSSPLPFCEQCKIKLIGLMGINSEEKSGKKEVAEEIQGMKKIMRECEADFDDCGIYDKDKRYHRVRRYIIKVAAGQVGRKLKQRNVNRLSVNDKLCEEEAIVKEEEDPDWRWEDEEPEIQIKEEGDSEENDDEVVEEDPLGPDTGTLQETDDPDENDDYERNCLLCYKAISKKESSLAPVLTNDLLEENLNSVFILRKMLGIPKDTLASYLESFGCPGKWVEYCKNCLSLVDGTLRIQKEISELADKLKKCEEKMKLKIKSTYKKKNGAAGVEDWDITRVTEETRKYVAKAVTHVGSDDDGPMEPWRPSDDVEQSSDEDVGRDIVEENRKPKKITAKIAKLSAHDKLRENRMNKFVNILKGGSYTCSLCPRKKNEKMSLAKFYSHLIFHAQRPFKCSICNLYWSGAEELEKNNPFAKEPNSENGHLCSAADLVKIPEDKFQPGKIWGCKWCPMNKFTVETHRDSHEDREHHDLKNELKMKYKCLSCNSAYRSFREWLLHRGLEHPEVAGISCLFCDYSAVIQTKEGIDILNGNEMSNHVNSVHFPSWRKRCECLVPESCDFCGVACKAGTDKMKRHVKTVHKLGAGLSTYSCPCCWVRYDHFIQLRWHIMLEHEQGQEQQVTGDEDNRQLELELPPQFWRPSADDDHLNTSMADVKPVAPPQPAIKLNKFEKILNDGSYTCRSCPNLMGKMTLAKFCGHVIFHAQRRFKCRVCNIYWSGPKELENNPFAREPPSNGHLCSEATLVRILGKFNPGEIWECGWCPDKFDAEGERDLHEDKEHFSLKREVEKNFKCLSCNSAYQSFRDWYVHRALEHPEVAGISCLYCDYTAVIQTKEGIDIQNGIQMREHIKLMHYPPNSRLRDVLLAPEICDFCGMGCKGGGEKLKRHVKRSHKLTSGMSTYSCPCCWSRFGEQSKLRKHILEEHGERQVESEWVPLPSPPPSEEGVCDEVEFDQSSDSGDDETPAKKPKLSGKNEEKSGDKLVKILKEGGYTCNLCPNIKGPMSLAYYYTHLIFHGRRPYKCSVCNLYWSGPKELEKNPFEKESTSSNGHLCSEATLVRVPLKTGEIWGCKWCPDKFEEERERDSHEDKEHSLLKNQLEMEHKCLSCNSAYRSFQEWQLHRALEHPEVAGISCLYCDYTAAVPTKDGIDILQTRQMRTHANSTHPQSCKPNGTAFATPETCDFCGVPFLGCSDKLGRHLKNVHKLTSGGSTYSCLCCWSRFGQLSELRKHLKEEHGGRRRPKRSAKLKVICDICGKGAIGKWGLADHKLSRHGIEPEEDGHEILTCEKGEECGGFRTLYQVNMREHMMRKHGAERIYKCGECGKGFTSNNKLWVHKEIHKNKGLRPHQCEICGNSFAVKNYLYIHMRLSHQNRPFASTNKKKTKKPGTR